MIIFGGLFSFFWSCWRRKGCVLLFFLCVLLLLFGCFGRWCFFVFYLCFCFFFNFVFSDFALDSFFFVFDTWFFSFLKFLDYICYLGFVFACLDFIFLLFCFWIFCFFWILFFCLFLFVFNLGFFVLDFCFCFLF